MKASVCGGNDSIGKVLSLNLHRRHLSSGQRAAIAVDMLPVLEAEAKKRQVLGGKEKVVAKIPQPRSRETAANEMKVSGRYVSDAKKIKAEKPQILDQAQQYY